MNDVIKQAMIAAVRHAAKFPFFSDLPDEMMWTRLKPIVKPEWLSTEPPLPLNISLPSYPPPLKPVGVDKVIEAPPRRGRPPKNVPTA